MKKKRPIWIDLDNSPHVPFFVPIIEQLRKRQLPVLITARDAYNVTELIQLYGVDCELIGHHSGRNKVMKVAGLGRRALQLAKYVASHAPSTAVSHGSRAQMIAAKLLRIPSLVIADYEHVTHITRPDYILMPEVIPERTAKAIGKKALSYKGIKEDVYASNFKPDPSSLTRLQLSNSEIVVTARPPASEAHYHVQESDKLFNATLDLLLSDSRTHIVMLPRNDKQQTATSSAYASHLQSGKITIPDKAVDGLNLIWHSDLVISGGGTMNREAAALGIPVYSTFRGPLGAVDRYLASGGRLFMLESVEALSQDLRIVKRQADAKTDSNTSALQCIVEHIVRVSQECP